MGRPRVFVIWDTTIDNLDWKLNALPQHDAMQDVDLRVLTGGAYDLLSGIEREVQASAGAVALVDKDNANVGFEVGLCLGHGRPVTLLADVEAHAVWLDGVPLRGTLIKGGFEPDALRAHIGTLEGSTWCVVEPGPMRPVREGQGEVLLLWPESKAAKFLEPARKGLIASTLPRQGWAVSDLPSALHGVKTVVWVVPQPEKGERDGAENTRLSVVAGYARARGVNLVVLWQKRKADDRTVRRLADVHRLAYDWTDLEELRALLEAHLNPSPKPEDILARYRRVLHQRHRNLVPFASASTVPMEVTLELVVDDLGDRRLSGLTLKEALNATGTGRLIVRAEPGAGKTTSARQLCQQAAADGPIPVLIPLASMADPSQDWFEFAEHDTNEPGLAAELRRAAETPGRVWLLLDGLDEVPKGVLKKLKPRLLALPDDKALAKVAVVLLGREVAFQDEAFGACTARSAPQKSASKQVKSGWDHATLRRLSADDQARLLARFVDDPEQQATLTLRIEQFPALGWLAGNPLLLTLFAVLGRNALAADREVPFTRIALYEEAIELLLRGDHRDPPTPVKDVEAARRLLMGGCRKMWAHPSRTWTTKEARAALYAAVLADAELSSVLKLTYDGSVDALLGDLRSNGGVFGEFDGAPDVWSFLHRSFREVLFAAGLLADARRLRDFEAGWQQDEATSEVMALVTSSQRGPEARLRALAVNNPEALMRLLRSTEGLSPDLVLDLLLPLPMKGDDGMWDGDDLVPAMMLCAGGREGRLDALWRRVGAGLDLVRLGVVWEALARVAVNDRPRTAWELVGPDRARFFREAAIALPDPKAVASSGWAAIHAGSFRMGSADAVGDADEHPQHLVTLTRGFRLGTHAVTTEQYRRFANGHRPNDGANLPATGVSWYEALLYAAWLGGRLPTEAEWEYACRAGTSTAWSFGDDEAKLLDHAWYDKNAGGTDHPVGQKRPNPWGLFDMHGNVWEWCLDDRRAYTDAEVADPLGAPGGGRAVRGGSGWFDAGRCRSACRDGGWPWVRDVDLGFRVLLPSPAP